MKIGRIILDKQNFADAQHTVDDEVVAVLQIPHISTVLRTARLRYLSRLMRFAPSILVVLLQRLEFADPDAWLTRVKHDVHWMQQRVQRLQHLPDPLVDWDAWKSHYMAGRDWALAAISAMNADTTYRHSQARYRLWRRDFQAEMKQLGLTFQEEAPVSLTKAWKCEQCGAGFLDNKSRSVHMYKVHHQHAEVRAYMDSTTCGACLKDFHTIQKLRQHLQHRPDRCLRMLQTVWHPFDAAVLKDFKPTLEVKHAHRLPALQCYGPFLPPRAVWQQQKPDKVVSYVISDTGGGCATKTLMNEMAVMTVQFKNKVHDQARMTTWCRSSSIWQSMLRRPLYRRIGICWLPKLFKHLWHLVIIFMKIYAHSWIRKCTLRYIGGWKVCWRNIFNSSETLLCRSNRMNPRWQKQRFKRQGTNRNYGTKTAIDVLLAFPFTHFAENLVQRRSKRFVLYAYSGHRREGDVVEWTQHFNNLFDYNVVMVTVDVVYEADLCDLRNADSKSLWLKAIRDGRIYRHHWRSAMWNMVSSSSESYSFWWWWASTPEKFGSTMGHWDQHMAAAEAGLGGQWPSSDLASHDGGSNGDSHGFHHGASCAFAVHCRCTQCLEVGWNLLAEFDPFCQKAFGVSRLLWSQVRQTNGFLRQSAWPLRRSVEPLEGSQSQPGSVDPTGRKRPGRGLEDCTGESLSSSAKCRLGEKAIFLKAQKSFEVRVDPDDSFLRAVRLVQIAQETSGNEMGADFARWEFLMHGVKARPTSARKGKRLGKQPPTSGSYDHVSFFRSFTGHFPENPIMPGVLQVEAKSRRRFLCFFSCRMLCLMLQKSDSQPPGMVLKPCKILW